MTDSMEQRAREFAAEGRLMHGARYEWRVPMDGIKFACAFAASEVERERKVWVAQENARAFAVWRGTCGHVWDSRTDGIKDCPLCAERAAREQAERERDEAVRDADYQEQLAAQACGESDALRAKLLLVTEALRKLDGSLPCCRICGGDVDERGNAYHDYMCYVGTALAAAEPDCRAIRRKYRVEGWEHGYVAGRRDHASRADIMQGSVCTPSAEEAADDVDARWPEDHPSAASDSQDGANEDAPK